ncbi:MAG: DNRLRE domain-containing protein, partial [Acidimicrobiia bacterium]
MMATRPISLLPFEKAPHILVRNALQILLVMAMIAATLIVLPSRAEAGVPVSFQEGVDGYSGTADTILNEGAPDADNSANTTLIVDLLNNVPESEVKQVLLRFDGIFGSAAGQIPLGSTISSATLGINVTNTSDVGADLYRMLEPWLDTESWSDWGNGIDTDDLEAASVSESGSPGSGLGAAEIDVTADLQAWSDGDPNHG